MKPISDIGLQHDGHRSSLHLNSSYQLLQYLNELDVKLIGDLIRVNVEVTTRLTRLVIPGMLKKRRGAIVNVGSGAATVLPSDPLYAVYAGTKG
jgi:17beta-estradiol 17-dehydrogenase / very-long-chain 3-oxoacyl-CoA reductase